MRFRNQHKRDNTSADMTPMIDIVFQLLAFFVMTFKITALEADFNVKMPLSSNQASPIDEVPPHVIQVNLRSGTERNIAGIDVDSDFDSQSFSGPTMFQELTGFIESTLGENGDPSTAGEVEVEFVIDPALKYVWTVQAMESVSGKKLPNGEVKRLVEKIKFRNPGQ
jgi:biopolymer transport protein ExbD